jgi:hypothetical protein
MQVTDETASVHVVGRTVAVSDAAVASDFYGVAIADSEVIAINGSVVFGEHQMIVAVQYQTKELAQYKETTVIWWHGLETIWVTVAA